MSKDFGTANCKRKTCGHEFKLKRQGQRYCSTRCQAADGMSRHRKRQNSAKKSHNVDSGHQTHGGWVREAITPPEKNGGNPTCPAPQKQAPTSWDKFEGRLCLYLYDEAPSIGCGWRSLTVKVRGKRVRLLNHWTGDAKWITREDFERLAAHSLANGQLPTETPVTSRLTTKVQAPPQRVVATAPLWDGPPLQGDAYTLDCYEDGYPRLPACLRRRAPIRLVVSNPSPQAADADGAAGAAAA